ncbi:MAG: hypothetical protein WCF85_10345 [Rhodospirillaceae bacterium]
MGSGFLYNMIMAISTLDPGPAILRAVQPALTLFQSESSAPDLSAIMVISALIIALIYRILYIRPACEILRIRTRFLKKCTTNRIFSDNFFEFDLLMKEGSFLEPSWNEFVETCLTHDPAVKSDVEITVRPSDYLNIDDAEHAGLNIKWFRGLSGLYVGAGLLFTFAGLIAALYFTSAAVNQVISASGAAEPGQDANVLRALALLLSTASFKFLTSIAGLSCAIVLAFLERRWCAKIRRGFNDLCRELERCTVMVTPESIADRQTRMLGEIVDLLARTGPARAVALRPVQSELESAPPPPPPALPTNSEPSAAAVTVQMHEAIDRIEGIFVATTRALATSFEQSLARSAAFVNPVRPEASQTSSKDSEAALAAALAPVLERSLGNAVTNANRLLTGTLEEVVARILVPALTRPTEGPPLIHTKLTAAVEQLSDTLNQVEGKLTTHLAAFDRLTRAAGETEHVIITATKSLQSAAVPLSRVGTELAVSVAALTSGVEGSVRALQDGQHAGQQLSDELRATCEVLQEVWTRHEDRFVSVDEGLARILSSIIQHVETHSAAVRDNVVTIDTNFARAVTSLAANIEALRQLTASEPQG